MYNGTSDNSGYQVIQLQMLKFNGQNENSGQCRDTKYSMHATMCTGQKQYQNASTTLQQVQQHESELHQCTDTSSSEASVKFLKTQMNIPNANSGGT